MLIHKVETYPCGAVIERTYKTIWWLLDASYHKKANRCPTHGLRYRKCKGGLA